jgi:hypothetical protein
LEQRKKENGPLTSERTRARETRREYSETREAFDIRTDFPAAVSGLEWAIVVASDSSLLAAQDELRKAVKISPAAKIFKEGRLS